MRFLGALSHPAAISSLEYLICILGSYFEEGLTGFKVLKLPWLLTFVIYLNQSINTHYFYLPLVSPLLWDRGPPADAGAAYYLES